MMKFIFQLSGEHPVLPKAEILAVLEGEKIKYNIFHENRKTRILIIDAKTKNPEFISRFAMTVKAAEFVAMTDDLDEIAKDIYKKIPKPKTFAVRSESHELEKKLGGKIWNLGLEVNLTKPDFKVLCFRDNKKYITGIEIPLRKDFNPRKPQFRPFFHPTSMHPKIARLLVNLARIKKDDNVLDPFCGTGGILIEAGLMGIKVFGSDISERMIEGCRENLNFYNITGEIRTVDATKIDKEFHGIDAIVTDPPYGRSSAVFGGNKTELYKNFLKSAANSLKAKGTIVIVTPMEFSRKLKGFEVIGKYSIRVHKSLTRRILVLSKI